MSVNFVTISHLRLMPVCCDNIFWAIFPRNQNSVRGNKLGSTLDGAKASFPAFVGECDRLKNFGKHLNYLRAEALRVLRALEIILPYPV